MLLTFGACVSSSKSTTTPPEQQKALQKKTLKERVLHQAATQNRIIDSLIKAKDPRLKKDKNGAYMRPNRILSNGTPVYFSTNHGRSIRKAIKADALGNEGTTGLNLDGSGIHVGVWDAGHIFAAHEEFTGGPDFFGYQVPIEIADAETPDLWDGHPTAVASIIIAKGLFHRDDYDVTGVAPNLERLYSYDWDDDVLEILDQLQTNNNTDFILSNHSYGYPLIDRDGNILEDQYIGDYSEWSAVLDNIIYVYPKYLHIAAAGNDGNNSYPAQEVVGLDQLTGSTTAKNVLTVASFSMDDDGTRFRASGFSSAGPTNDFRIKPEISVLGSQVAAPYWFVSTPDEMDGYLVGSGTSFAAPGAAGGIALLQQLYQEQTNSYMTGATVKALICHTADDIDYWYAPGDIPGPDVKTGYGALNLEQAAALMQQDADTEPNALTEFTLSDGKVKRLFFIGNDEGALQATLAWFDPNADVDAAIALVNDLDLRIYEGTETFFPWKLPTAVQQVTAIKGDNDRDNLEKISIPNVSNGFYEIVISHKGRLVGGQQNASLVLSGPGTFFASKAELEKLNPEGVLVMYDDSVKIITVVMLLSDNLIQSVALYDLMGREVARQSKGNSSSTNTRIDTAHLATGVYVLGIKTATKSIFRSFLLN